jgi:hypothetical protein
VISTAVTRRAAARGITSVVVGSLVLPLLLLGGLSCRAREGQRCICGDDCRAGLVCVSDGSILQSDACAPATGSDASPGVCVDEDAAEDGEGGTAPPAEYYDLGAKRDFFPSPPGDGSGDSSGSTTATESSTDGTAGTTTTGSSSSDSSGSSSTGSSSSGSSGSSSGSSGDSGSSSSTSSSSGNTTDATGSSSGT